MVCEESKNKVVILPEKRYCVPDSLHCRPPYLPAIKGHPQQFINIFHAIKHIKIFRKNDLTVANYAHLQFLKVKIQALQGFI